MASSATEEQVPLKILVDEVKNKVVFVQAGKDFVDALLSFLTLPLGTIARLVGKESNTQKVSVGSLSSLYESVAKIEEKHFWTETCKEMLLQPRNSMEACCRNLKLNIDDTEKTKYFICENWDCIRQSSAGLLSTFRNKRCRCGKPLNREMCCRDSPADESVKEGFVPEMATFIISDDLRVMPDNFQTCALNDEHILGYEDFDSITEVALNVTQKEVVDLLKCSLLSKTPLTDLFLRNAQPRSVSNSDIGEVEANVGRNETGKMNVKVMLRKSNSNILFALAEEDFVNFLLSFLTFPLGGVEQLLNGNSFLGSIDNLYKSMVDLDGSRYLRSPDLKDKLVNSKLAYQFKLLNHILPISESYPSNYYCYSNLDSMGKVSGYIGRTWQRNNNSGNKQADLNCLEPQSSTGETYNSNYGGRGFAKRPSLYMVTDDLIVTPSSSISAVSFLTKSKIPPYDLEERSISIGKKEGLSILKASLISSSALTHGLRQFIKPINIKDEKFPN